MGGCLGTRGETSAASAAVARERRRSSLPLAKNDDLKASVRRDSTVAETLNKWQHSPEELATHQFAGFVHKRSDWKHEWRKRYLVLKGSHLYNCNAPGDHPHAALCLTRHSVTHAVDDEAKSTRPFTFEVVESAHGASWLVSCESDKERTAWIEAIQECIDDIHLFERYQASLLATLQKGATFTKFHHDTLGKLSRGQRARTVQVTDFCDVIQWFKPEEEGHMSGDSILVADVKKVVSGAETQAFALAKRSVDPERCFSIITTHRTLDLVADTKKQRDEWVDGMRALVKFGLLADREAKQEELNQAAVDKAESAAALDIMRKRAQNRDRQRFQETLKSRKAGGGAEDKGKGKSRLGLV